MTIDPRRRFQLTQAFSPPGTGKYIQPKWYEPGELSVQDIQSFPPNVVYQPEATEEELAALAAAEQLEAEAKAQAETPAAPTEASTTTTEASTISTETSETRKRRSPATGSTGE